MQPSQSIAKQTPTAPLRNDPKKTVGKMGFFKNFFDINSVSISTNEDSGDFKWGYRRDHGGAA
jgi:hypothetical protein